MGPGGGVGAGTGVGDGAGAGLGPQDPFIQEPDEHCAPLVHDVPGPPGPPVHTPAAVLHVPDAHSEFAVQDWPGPFPVC